MAYYHLKGRFPDSIDILFKMTKMKQAYPWFETLATMTNEQIKKSLDFLSDFSANEINSSLSVISKEKMPKFLNKLSSLNQQQLQQSKTITLEALSLEHKDGPAPVAGPSSLSKKAETTNVADLIQASEAPESSTAMYAPFSTVSPERLDVPLRQVSTTAIESEQPPGSEKKTVKILNVARNAARNIGNYPKRVATKVKDAFGRSY